MGSTAHIGEGKRELAKDVHRLARLGIRHRFRRRRNRSDEQGRVIISFRSRRVDRTRVSSSSYGEGESDSREDNRMAQSHQKNPTLMLGEGR
ncbi:hypothetical protein MTR67_039607 [Solanum verrucosum]|uniref:Uncharacterized protein n=1 Tax=Solanum verrucosum TaxID=315347 RepID=A0AAF0UHI3_SOLVR|nr:hypothetical protein MTR67_039607 [Solanum verrucosum]